MNTKSTNDTGTGPATAGDVLAGDDQVIVEELFIEEYEAPILLQDPSAKKPRRSALRRVRSHPKSIIGSLLAFGAVVLAALFAGRRRKASLFARAARKVGIPI